MGNVIFGLHEMLHEERVKIVCPELWQFGYKTKCFCSKCFRVQEFHSFHGRRDDEMGRSSRPMDFVRGIIVEDGKRFMGSSHFPGYSVEQIADCLLKADVQ